MAGAEFPERPGYYVQAALSTFPALAHDNLAVCFISEVSTSSVRLTQVHRASPWARCHWARGSDHVFIFFSKDFTHVHIHLFLAVFIHILAFINSSTIIGHPIWEVADFDPHHR